MQIKFQALLLLGLVNIQALSAPSDAKPANKMQKMEDISADGIKAMADLYFASKVEEMKVFAVADRIVERFQGGLGPEKQTAAALSLQRYIEGSGKRLSSKERNDLYARILGIAADDSTKMANRSFGHLWQKFLIAMDSPNLPAADQVAAGKNLVRNLSAHFSKTDIRQARVLEEQVRETMGLLADPDLHRSYGASGIWDLIAKISMQDLNGVACLPKLQDMGEKGQAILNKLADNIGLLYREKPSPLAHIFIVDARAWVMLAGKACDFKVNR